MKSLNVIRLKSRGNRPRLWKPRSIAGGRKVTEKKPLRPRKMQQLLLQMLAQQQVEQSEEDEERV